MANENRQQTIDSWHVRADPYEMLISTYRIFTDMAMGMIEFVGKQQLSSLSDLHVIDLAAGTGLVSKLLIEHLHLSSSSLYLIEPAERMSMHARDKIKGSHVLQMPAEDCLFTPQLPRDDFDFILCNASMHLMSETDIYPIVTKLLKPTRGYFLYTLWYHAFNETSYYDKEDFEMFINEALAFFGYPGYYSMNTRKTDTCARTRKYLEETALNNGLVLHSCTIHLHRVPLSFDLDFALMTSQWLVEHLTEYRTNQDNDVRIMKERVVQKARELMFDKFSEIPVVQVIIARA